MDYLVSAADKFTDQGEKKHQVILIGTSNAQKK